MVHYIERDNRCVLPTRAILEELLAMLSNKTSPTQAIIDIKRDCIALAFQATPFAQLSSCLGWLGHVKARTSRAGRARTGESWAEVRRGSSSMRQCAHANNRGYASVWHAHARLYLYNTTCNLYELSIVSFRHHCHLTQKTSPRAFNTLQRWTTSRLSRYICMSRACRVRILSTISRANSRRSSSTQSTTNPSSSSKPSEMASSTVSKSASHTPWS